jgi:hypothetical protein
MVLSETSVLQYLLCDEDGVHQRAAPHTWVQMIRKIQKDWCGHFQALSCVERFTFLAFNVSDSEKLCPFCQLVSRVVISDVRHAMNCKLHKQTKEQVP